MAMLDLQSMVAPTPKGKAPNGSRGSKGCVINVGGGGRDNVSGFSLALCAF